MKNYNKPRHEYSSIFINGVSEESLNYACHIAECRLNEFIEDIYIEHVGDMNKQFPSIGAHHILSLTHPGRYKFDN